MEEQEEEKKPHIVKDLAESVLNGCLGGVMGFVGSFTYPMTIPETIKDIRREKIKNFRDYATRTGIFAGYTLGITTIVSMITENPQDPVSYIPIATNLIAGGIDATCRWYNIGKERGKQEKALELEREVK